MSTALVSPGEPGAIAADLARRFEQATGGPPVGVFAAPGRVNLIGEHLDYNGGRCLPLALPHATYAAVAPRGDGVLALRSLQQPEPWRGRVADLAPGSVPGWAAYAAGVVWALRAQGWAVPGMDVLVDSRVPVGAGLSSSAALECSIALAAAVLAGAEDTDAVRRVLVAAAIRAEAEMAGAPTGGMDQSVALFAEAGHALLLDFADDSHRTVPWEPAAAGLELVVVDTRVAHELADGGYAARRADCETAARALGVSALREVPEPVPALDRLADERVRRRARHVFTEMARVEEALAALGAGDVAAVAPLLDASHASLRDDYEVSCAELDVAVDTAREHGAVGARMTGGGFGGSAIALVPTDRLAGVCAAVEGAFGARGWAAPLFLAASAGAAAHRVRWR
jgi:galactokinase